MSVKVKKTEKPKKDDAETSKTKTTPAIGRMQHPLLALREEVDHLFDNFFSGFAIGPFGEFGRSTLRTEPFRRFEDAFAGLAPSLSIKADVRESDDAYRIQAEMPGVEEDGVDVSVSDGMLTITGEKKEEKKEDREDYHLTERHYGSVKRTFPVPDTVDLSKAEASFKNGVLNITLPKKALPKAKATKIPISGR
ncbi:Hsp20/alpha crystallin family protein [Magnetovibrio sp.]|uniref:Hsp20/alpha crystallin family protein n=1 Tax=Magnetovibrio sp. TaxID=2024836 RepID=UPI002F91E3FB